MNHRIILSDGRTALLSTGATAIQGEGGCPECCGEGDLTGPCTCRPLVYADRTCGVPRDSTWTVRVAGSVTYANSYIRTDRGNAVVLSSVASQTRTFDQTRTVGAGICGGLISYPVPPQPDVTFIDTATGPDTANSRLIVGCAVSSSSQFGGGWNVVNRRNQWGETGVTEYNPNTNHLIFSPSTDGTFFGIRVVGSTFGSGPEDVAYAAFESATTRFYGGARLLAASPAALQAQIPVGFSSSQSGSLTLNRTACTYTARRVFSASFSGAFISNPTLRVDRSGAFSGDYTITAQLVRCTAPGALIDPRVLNAAEQQLRRCVNCGDR